MELLRTCRRAARWPTTGLRHVHNDTCYPAILVGGAVSGRAGRRQALTPHSAALMLYSRRAAAAGPPTTFRCCARRWRGAGLGAGAGDLLQPGGGGEAAGLHSCRCRCSTGCCYGGAFTPTYLDGRWRDQCRPYEREAGQARSAWLDAWTAAPGRGSSAPGARFATRLIAGASDLPPTS